MKDILKLSNYIFNWFMASWGKLIFLCTGFFSSYLLFQTATPLNQKDSYNFQAEVFYSYDMVVDQSGVVFVFLLGLCLLFLGIFLEANRHTINGKSIYTLLTLPMSRKKVFYSFFCFAVVTTLLYFAFWLALMSLWYFPATWWRAKEAAEVIFSLGGDQVVTNIDVSRTGGFALAFGRSTFLGHCFPMFDLQGLVLVSGIFLAMTATLVAGLCQGKGLRSFLFVFVVFGLYSAFVDMTSNGLYLAFPGDFFWSMGKVAVALLLLGYGSRWFERQKRL